MTESFAVAGAAPSPCVVHTSVKIGVPRRGPVIGEVDRACPDAFNVVGMKNCLNPPFVTR
jgi:hypothetical protein